MTEPNRPLDTARTSAGQSTDVRTQTKRETETKTITTPSSRGMALAATVEDLARIVVSIRSEWGWLPVVQAICTDDRPWRTVVLAAVNGAADPEIRHPNGLRYVNATSKGAPTPTPPAFRREVILCRHEAESGLCALCRTEGINS